MIDFKNISEMTHEQWTTYVHSLDSKTICLNRDILNFINGFILCKELHKYELEDSQINNILYAFLKGNYIKELENLYKV